MIYANSMRSDLITIEKFQYDDDDVDVKERNTHSRMLTFSILKYHLPQLLLNT